jgi:hypothetical protein
MSDIIFIIVQVGSGPEADGPDGRVHGGDFQRQGIKALAVAPHPLHQIMDIWKTAGLFSTKHAKQTGIT